MHIDQLLSLVAVTEQQSQHYATQTFQIPMCWAQGRTVFGGLSAGLVYQAMKNVVADENRVLRSLTINFVGPLLGEVDCEIQVDYLRKGGNVSQLTAAIKQNGEVKVFGLAAFGDARLSGINVEITQAHDLPAVNDRFIMPSDSPVAPTFLQHIDIALLDGTPPFSGSSTGNHGGYMRFKQAAETLSDAHIITLIDAWPPTILQMANEFCPVSTLSWNIEFLHPHRPLQGGDWLAFRAHTRQAGDGYGHSEATVWDSHNEVIALSRQTITIFDKRN